MRVVLVLTLLFPLTASATISSARLSPLERMENRFAAEDIENTEKERPKNSVLCDLCVLRGESASLPGTAPLHSDRNEQSPLDGGAVYVMSGQSNETWHGQAKFTGLNIELVSARSPRTDIGFVLTPLTIHQPKSWFGDEYDEGHEDVSALLASLLLRRRFNTGSSRLQFYGETSIGPMWAEKPVPASTSRFNFATQFGAGVVLLPQSRFPIVTGYRFMHVSNGGYSPRNPGLNLSSLILGMRYRR